MATRLEVLRRTLDERLRRGEHMVLYGPRGSGKSLLLLRLHEHLCRSGIACGYAPRTRALDDITRAFTRAYPAVATADTTRRNARARLRLAAESTPGVLVLDHLGYVGTAMLGCLRRLRGGPLGVVMAVDVDVPRERERLRAWHLGTPSLAMPPASSRALARLLRERCAHLGVPCAVPGQEREIVHAARGRPGWIVRCAELMREPRYWHGDTLYVSLLCGDAEIALRLAEG